VFEPLGLRDTGWRLDELAARGVQVVPPHAAGASVGHYGVAEWPAAGLRTSLRDFLLFLTTFTAEQPLILSAASRDLMLPPSFRGGLAWWGGDATYGEKAAPLGAVWSHGGFMHGIRSHVYLWPHRGVALLILQAGEAPYEAACQAATQAHISAGHLSCRKPAPYAARCARLLRAAALPAATGRDDAERALAPADAQEALSLCDSPSALARLRACKAAMALLCGDDAAAERLFERRGGEAQLRRVMLPRLPPAAAGRLACAAAARGATSDALTLLPFAGADVVDAALDGNAQLISSVALLPPLAAGSFWARLSRRHPSAVLRCLGAALAGHMPPPPPSAAASAAARQPSAALALLTASPGDNEEAAEAMAACAACVPSLLRVSAAPFLSALLAAGVPRESRGGPTRLHRLRLWQLPWSARGAARAAASALGPPLVEAGWLPLSDAALRATPPGEARAALWLAYQRYTERSGNDAPRAAPALIALLPEPLRSSAAAACLACEDADERAAVAAVIADAAGRDAATAEALGSGDGGSRCAAAAARAVGALRLGSPAEAAAALAELCHRGREAEPARRALVDALKRHFELHSGPRSRWLPASLADALRSLLLRLQAAADTSEALRQRCFAVLVYSLAAQSPAADATGAAAALRAWRGVPGRSDTVPPLWAVQWAALSQPALPILTKGLLAAFCGDEPPGLAAVLAAAPCARAVGRA
jgi:hypothetical protein